MLLLPKCAFIDIPKCGCTSIFKALDEYPKPHWHQRNIESDLPKVAVVRDPYARALSIYHFEVYQCSIGNKRLHPGGAEAFYDEWKLHSLDAFLELIIENKTSQSKGFPAHYPNFLPCGLFLEPLEPVDYILHLESLQSDWDACEVLPPVRIPHERRGNYDPALTNEQRAMIREWADADFEKFGYER